MTHHELIAFMSCNRFFSPAAVDAFKERMQQDSITDRCSSDDLVECYETMCRLLRLRYEYRELKSDFLDRALLKLIEVQRAEYAGKACFTRLQAIAEAIQAATKMRMDNQIDFPVLRASIEAAVTE